MDKNGLKSFIIFLVCGVIIMSCNPSPGGSDTVGKEVVPDVIANQIEEFVQEIVTDPEDAAAYFNRGNVHLEMGDYDLAIADFDHAIKVHPFNVWTYYNRGNVYSEMGDCEQAIADYDMAITVNSHNEESYYFRGECLSKIGEKSKAISDLKTALEMGLPTELQVRAEELIEDLR